LAWLPHNEDLLPTTTRPTSTIDADIDSLFDSSGDDETDIVSDADIDSLLEIDDDIDNNGSLFDDKIRHPLEYYLVGAANLDVKRLWQLLYSPT